MALWIPRELPAVKDAYQKYMNPKVTFMVLETGYTTGLVWSEASVPTKDSTIVCLLDGKFQNNTGLATTVTGMKISLVESRLLRRRRESGKHAAEVYAAGGHIAFEEGAGYEVEGHKRSATISTTGSIPFQDESGIRYGRNHRIVLTVEALGQADAETLIKPDWKEIQEMIEDRIQVGPTRHFS